MSVPKRPFSQAAIARLGAVSLIDHYLSQGYKQVEAIEIAATRACITPNKGGRCPSTRTLYRWRARHKDGGVEALENRVREPLQGSRVFPLKLLDFAVTEHSDDPVASVPELIRRARATGIIDDKLVVKPGSLWRVLTRMGLEFTRRPAALDKELRRFSHRERMQCVLVDGKHFRAGATETKRMVFYFLDDATRRGLVAIVGPSESANLTPS